MVPDEDKRFLSANACNGTPQWDRYQIGKLYPNHGDWMQTGTVNRNELQNCVRSFEWNIQFSILFRTENWIEIGNGILPLGAHDGCVCVLLYIFRWVPRRWRTNSIAIMAPNVRRRWRAFSIVHWVSMKFNCSESEAIRLVTSAPTEMSIKMSVAISVIQSNLLFSLLPSPSQSQAIAVTCRSITCAIITPTASPSMPNVTTWNWTDSSSAIDRVAWKSSVHSRAIDIVRR